ncbi:hypothetical protein CV102_04155 [Natronococcus pandeyae]|uniref:Uncharacterized protein n=1 Tax=Natronococcus pandeyae TaxID=2055836 RepID=A0A8J8Q5M4_9EURY|nr:hypothetical protein CV102_04155 [Natronococcus pandeyae]
MTVPDCRRNPRRTESDLIGGAPVADSRAETVDWTVTANDEFETGTPATVPRRSPETATRTVENEDGGAPAMEPS